MQKITAHLADAKADGVSMPKVCDAALRKVGMTNRLAAELTKAAMLRNVAIAKRLGCINALGLAEMRPGRSATVGRGPYTGDELSVDHILPFAVLPELDKVIANLELMPLRMNVSKNASVGSRQRDLAVKLHAAGLLSDAGLRKVQGKVRWFWPW